VEISHDLPEVFVAVVLFLAGFQLLRLAFGYWAVRRLKSNGSPAGLAVPISLSRPVDVLVSERIAMPMAVGYRRPAILLPRALVDRLTPEELRHVLLHESAHLLRKDDWIALAERVVRAVFFFQPAVYWIGRQIEQEREIACDDWVVAQSGNPKPYATSLARLAELGSARGRSPILATGAGRPKQIFGRLNTLLDRTRNGLPTVSEPMVLVAGAILLFAVAQGAHFNHFLGFAPFSNRWVESNGANRREFRTRGEIRFTANDQDVESMSPGARFLVEVADGWRVRSVEFEADEQGNIERRYFADGIRRPFDPEAQRFLAKVLPPWIREQGHDIPERLARMIHDKGPDGALQDIKGIHSDSVKRRYLEELFSQTALSPGQVARALKTAGEINSDGDKRRFLEAVHDRYLDRSLDAQVFAFIDSINSDDDRRHLLAQVIERGEFDDGSMARLLRSASKINSDGAKADLLRRAAQASKKPLPAAFFDAAASINSDGDRARSLSTVLAVHGDHPATVVNVLRVAGSINSDGEKAKILIESARSFRGGQDALREASRALGTIHSDGDRRRCLEAFIDADGKNADTMREVLLQTMSINSDGDKSHLLQQLAGIFPEVEPVRHAFFSAANTINSSGEHRRVLMAVLERNKLEAETLRDISRSATQISSDGDQAAVLKAISARR
jgi:hypothetical protein